MTDLAALVESIRANPHDSLCRKVLADELEERGNFGLADLIRRTGIVGPLKIGDGGGGGGYGDGGGGGDGGWSPYVLVGWVERDDLFLRVRNCRIVGTVRRSRCKRMRASGGSN